MTSMNVGAVDIGTNSVRLLITDAAGHELARAMRITRLGQGVDVTGSLHPDAITRTTQVLAGYGAELARLDVRRVRAAATSAARDAENSAAFFDAAERALGTRPELLSGEEEALLSFRGATAGLSAEDGPFLVIDLGGGSTEFVRGAREPEAAISVQMGCVRMSERYLKSDPPARAELEACFAGVDALLPRVREVIDIARARRVIGLAGTVTTLSALDLGLKRYDASRTHHSLLSRARVAVLTEQLAVADLAERRALLVDPKRAEVIVGGAAVLLCLMRGLALDELLVSEHDILDGLAASLR